MFNELLQIQTLFQKRLILIFCLIAQAFAIDKQIKLEDIERDNLAAEKQRKHSRMQTGTFDTRPQQFIPSPQLPSSPAPPQFHNALRSQQLQFVPINYQKPPYAAPQQYLIPNEKYYNQQPSYQFQYVTPQTQNVAPNQNFVFVQPITAETNQVPKFVQQKNVQYLMILDPNVHILRNPHVQANLLKEDAHQHNLAGLLQKNAYTNSIPQNYRAPAPAQPVQPAQPTPLQNFGFQSQQPYYFVQPTPQFQYMFPTFAPPKYQRFEQQVQSSIPSLSVAPKRQPTSLLDSYIPSAVQIQYLKQLQEAASHSVPQIVKYDNARGEAYEYEPVH